MRKQLEERGGGKKKTCDERRSRDKEAAGRKFQRAGAGSGRKWGIIRLPYIFTRAVADVCDVELSPNLLGSLISAFLYINYDFFICFCLKIDIGAFF